MALTRKAATYVITHCNGPEIRHTHTQRKKEKKKRKRRMKQSEEENFERSEYWCLKFSNI